MTQAVCQDAGVAERLTRVPEQGMLPLAGGWMLQLHPVATAPSSRG